MGYGNYPTDYASETDVATILADIASIQADTTTLITDVAAVQATADAIEVDTTAIQAETDKIDSAVTDGLAGTSNSLAYRVHEIEKHLHNEEVWLGLSGSPSGEVTRAEVVDGGTQPFVLTAGNNAFGSWVQVLGSGDTPVKAGYAKFDPHRYLVTDTNSTNPFIVQVTSGESADLAAKVAAFDYTAVMYVSATNNNDSGISDVIASRCVAGAKLWARCACIGSSGSTMDVYYGIHEYAG